MLTILDAVPSDATSIAVLLLDLGYPAAVPEVTARLERLDAMPDHALFIATVDGNPAGLCQIQGIRLIASDGYAEIHAFVVARRFQKRGVGRALVDHAAKWARSAGYRRVRLRSGAYREDAQGFYEALGFTRTETSYIYEKEP